MLKLNFFLTGLAFLFSINVFAKNTPAVSTVLDQSPIKTDEKFLIELFNYEEYVYSQSKKTEIGDQLELKTRFRYQFSDKGWASFGFTTIPEENRFDNKTSEFELRSGYSYDAFTAQVDLTLNTSDSDGGITFGPDVDSENSFLRYQMTDKLRLTFFPFNFNGEVGVEFNTNDVTRIFFVDDAPSVINVTPNDEDRIVMKTIPGFELSYNDFDDDGNGLSLYGGLGTATYLYPNDPNFDITQTAAALSWSRNEDIGYKFGALLRKDNSFTSFQYVGHTEDAETGALLKSAASFYSLNRLGKFMLEFETTATEAGSQPYRLSRSDNWFETGDPIGADALQRVYKDRNGDLQNWVGEWGVAASLKLGVAKQGYTPYLSYKYQDENFIFRERESAHRLRTNNESESHGGLHRLGFGAYLYKGNFIINPRFEYLLAENDVFSDRNDVTQERIISGFKDQDFLLFINVAYFFDKRTGPRTFRL